MPQRLTFAPHGPPAGQARYPVKPDIHRARAPWNPAFTGLPAARAPG